MVAALVCAAAAEAFLVMLALTLVNVFAYQEAVQLQVVLVLLAAMLMRYVSEAVVSLQQFAGLVTEPAVVYVLKAVVAEQVCAQLELAYIAAIYIMAIAVH